MIPTEIQLLFADGTTLGWPYSQEAEALAWRAENAPGCLINYLY